MSRGDELRRQDIVDACSELAHINDLRGGTDDGVLIRAAERLLEIIGEAATHLSQAFTDKYPDVDWEGIAGLRVILAHLYHRIEPDLIWRFVEHDAPMLTRALRSQ